MYGRMMDAAADREQRGPLLVKSAEQYRKAITEARKVGDEASQAYSLGFLAGLYETEGRYDEALQLRDAVLINGELAQPGQRRQPPLGPFAPFRGRRLDTVLVTEPTNVGRRRLTSQWR